MRATSLVAVLLISILLVSAGEQQQDDKFQNAYRLIDSYIAQRMKAEQARAQEENQRLSRELDGLRGRIASTETMSSELSTLKEERDVIRTRVTEMLEQLDALNL